MRVHPVARREPAGNQNKATKCAMFFNLHRGILTYQ